MNTRSANLPEAAPHQRLSDLAFWRFVTELERFWRLQLLAALLIALEHQHG